MADDDKQANLPPMNLEAEQHVLGAALIHPPSIDECSEIVTADDFYRASNGLIWQACLDLRAAGDAVDAVLVSDRLEAQGDLDTCGGNAHLAELAAIVPAAANAIHYARIVREQARLRALVAAGLKLASRAQRRGATSDELLDQAEQDILALSQQARGGDLESTAEIAPPFMQRLIELSERGGDVVGLPTGYRELDRLTSGLQESNLVVVAARPSMGKSALALCITSNTIRTGLPVALFTFEMSKWEVMQRLVSMEAHVDSSHVTTPSRLDKDHWKRVYDAGATLAGLPLFIEDGGEATVAAIRSKARRLKLKQPRLALIVVDYIQLMSSGAKFENRVNEVSQISRGLKLLAKELRLPVLALSQLSRQVEQRHDKRPILSDLRESGSIEQDADVVMMLYRDEYYFPEEDDNKGVCEVNLVKHRNGPTGVRKLAFVSRYARFSDMAPTDGPQGVSGFLPD